ncbi:hypothetical protein ACWDBW_08000 [Streptomyces sp. NPDC001107]
MPAVGRATCTIRYEVDQLGAMAALGIDPPDLLRAHYRRYAGTGSAELVEQGWRWYEEVRRGRRTGPPFIARTLTALRAHQDAGHLTALVSKPSRPAWPRCARTWAPTSSWAPNQWWTRKGA